MTATDPLVGLLTAGAPALERPSAPVEWQDPALAGDIEALHLALDEFRRRHGFGRAIAAPQIGIAKRFIAVNLDGERTTLINPVIEWRSDDMFEIWDDCMSVPDTLVRVRRNVSITVSFSDAERRPQQWVRLPRATSELLQHEIDHLDGILMLSRAIDDDSIRPASERAQLQADA